MKKTLIKEIASALSAFKHCQKIKNKGQEREHLKTLIGFEEFLPHGCGFDGGTQILVDMSTDNKICFSTDFHHMQETGFYDGWTSHIVTVTPSFVCELEIFVSGTDKNDIKSHIGDVFYDCLTSIIP